MEILEQIARCLPPGLKKALLCQPPELRRRVQEIRIRAGRPLVLTLMQGPCILEGTTVTQEELNESFYALCRHSVYSYENELRQGFFTMQHGCRVGVAGISNVQQGIHSGFQAVTSLNIRLPCRIEWPLPEYLRDFFSDRRKSLMIVGPPGSGKTTLLRAVIGHLSRLGHTVSVVDERNELFYCDPAGAPQDIPCLCDVLTGMPKEQGILMALRTQNPDYIALDELGGMEDVEALEKGLYAGTGFIFSMHGYDQAGLWARPQYARLRQLLVPDALLFLGPRAGQVREFVPL